MIQPTPKLTKAVIASAIGRQTLNVFSVLVNTETGGVYMTVMGRDHSSVAAELLKLEDTEDLGKNREKLAKYVPAHIELNPEHTMAVGIVTGISGIEMSYRVFHTREQLETAHDMVKAFLTAGVLTLKKPLEKDEIVRQFQEKV
ncbi:hypothetical protein CMO91_06115 [Candidatus Woesearchaeota archaeon]|nr:hypothetical protein [Candidatus Woesearchaeota archaeon]|tara:strand:- start:625 stop:1056 length:432 start_codon:yes stop_codon:yes gene_type:complete